MMHGHMHVKRKPDSKKGRPETCRRPGQFNNLAPHKTNILQIFVLGQGWRTFLRARAQTSDNFSKTFYRVWKLEFAVTIFMNITVT
jgi:hypothetical protein